MRKSEKLELILLPPKEKKEVTKEDIVKAYTKLILLLNKKETIKEG